MSKPNSAEMTLSRAKHILPPEIAELGLTNKELKFVAGYCSNGFRSSLAVRSSGYRAKSGQEGTAQASSILRRDHVRKAIALYMDTLLQPYKDKFEYEILTVYYHRAYYDVDTFLNEDGTLKPLDQIPDEWHCCIDGIDRDVKMAAKQRVTIIKYKLPDRDLALQMLYKMLALASQAEKAPALSADMQARLDAIFDRSGGSTIRKMRVTVETVEAL